MHRAWVLALASMGCAGEGEAADDGGSDGSGTAERHIEAAFDLVDGSAFELDARSGVAELDTLTSCEGADQDAGYGVGIGWAPGTDLEPRTYALDGFTGNPLILVTWPHDDGVRATAADAGTLVVESFGSAAQSIIQGTFTDIDMMPDPADPRDRVRLITDGRFRCVVD